MENVVSNELLDDLYSYIPEFAEIVHSEMDKEFWYNSYLVFGRFGSVLSIWISTQIDNSLINRCYDFINRALVIPNTQIVQLITVTVFEILTDNNELISLTKTKLVGQALIIYNELLDSPMFKRAKS